MAPIGKPSRAKKTRAGIPIEAAMRLPRSPGVYRFIDREGRALYVGKAADLRNRVLSHLRQKNPSPRASAMLALALKVEIVTTASAAEALLVENNLIKELRPRFNVLFRDDKSYPFLRLSPHPYPRLHFYRGAKGADCFGPFPDSRAVRESIDSLQRAFRLRTCADGAFANRARPCLLHQIHRCSAPCVNKISPAAYAADAARARRLLRGGGGEIEAELQAQMEADAGAQRFEEAALLRDKIRALAAVRERHFAEDEARADADYVGVFCDGANACAHVEMVRGGRRIGQRRHFARHAKGATAGEVVAAFVGQRYAEFDPPRWIFVAPPPAAECRAPPGARLVARPRGEDKKRALAAVANARHALLLREGEAAARAVALRELADALDLPAPPARIECFDVSHTAGEETMAARVLAVDGEPHNAGYRRYKIRAAANDDYAATREAIFRSFAKKRRANDDSDDADDAEPPPDLLLIDGGVGQITAARAALAAAGFADTPILALAKGKSRKPGDETLIKGDGEIVELDPSGAAFRVAQRIRDEAHRFAIAGHRKRRDRKRRESALASIEGLGPTKRRRLARGVWRRARRGRGVGRKSAANRRRRPGARGAHRGRRAKIGLRQLTRALL